MKWLNMMFQDPSSPMMEQLITLHDHIMMILTMITILVFYMMYSILMNKMVNRFIIEGQMIEFIWTITPALMLVMIALPSLRTLYLIEESNKPMLTIKALGHQWYWSYEYSDLNNIEMESYMKTNSDLLENEMRLLETDYQMIMPFNTPIRILTSSTDVIHSWTIQSMGIKIDASPGRINQANLFISKPGIYYGQCSEICGANHSFMPIMTEVINMKSFMKWIKNN
uniref:Cytochrome c oxidase subunit 2 n=1 Tax=Olidiana tongmaiensis TaxID=2501809 RepID=A0A898PA79_9HEMI|nr:cytochrome c oxidase subunit II [Olidiana tongmaiensis]QSJ61396.1 cytochrome c oxidase subunit II [Olidiana tongmaiensis]